MTLEYSTAFVTLAYSDLDRLVQFYVGLLGEQPQIYRPKVYAEFSLKGLRLGIFQPKESHQAEFTAPSSGGMSLCLEVDDLDGAIAQLTVLEYPPPEQLTLTSHGREVYAYDPAGNRLILHQAS